MQYQAMHIIIYTYSRQLLLSLSLFFHFFALFISLLYKNQAKNQIFFFVENIEQKFLKLHFDSKHKEFNRNNWFKRKNKIVGKRGIERDREREREKHQLNKKQLQQL